MVERLTESRGGVKGGIPLQGQGTASLVGLGQRPNRSAGDQYAKRAQPRRRQRSVPASNFALPQERSQAAHSTTHILSRQMGATDQYGKRFVFPMLVFLLQEVSPLRRRVGGALRSPPTPLRTALPCFLIFLVAEGIAPAGATRGLSDRPLDPFGSHYRSWFFIVARRIASSTSQRKPL